MNCGSWQEMILEMVDLEPAPEELARLEAHMQHCTGCRTMHHVHGSPFTVHCFIHVFRAFWVHVASHSFWGWLLTMRFIGKKTIKREDDL